MSVKEISPGKKAKKLKQNKTDSDGAKSKKKSKIAPGIPADEDLKMTTSEPVKKSKKTRVPNDNDVADTDTVVEPTKTKSGKKRKRAQEEPSTGVDDDVAGSPDEPVKQKSGKKRKKSHTKDGEDAADADAVNDAAEEPSADKKPRSKKGENPVKPKDPEEEKRTVFVGNLPLKTERRKLRQFFTKFGKVESVRLRSAPRLDAKKPIRMAVITHRFSEDRASLNGYVRYVSEEGAQKAAAEANGLMFMEHRVRVGMALGDSRPDPSRAIFVGGLPLNVEDNQLWTRFEECGEIVSVRVVRDRQTSVGKGIGYVNFTEEGAVPRALKLNGSELEGRTIRVQRCHATAHAKVDRNTGKKLRKPRPEGGKGGGKTQDDKLAPVNKFSGDATAESKSAKKKKGNKKDRWDDAKRQKRSLAQSLSKTIAPAAAAKPSPAPTVAVGGVTPQNKKIKFNFGVADDDGAPPSEKKKDSEKLKEIKVKKEAKRKRKAKESEAKKKKSIVEPLTNLLPS